METQQKRIGIIGIGGVGGYYGGKLARAAKTVPGFEVVFIMRGEAKKVVSAQGLQVTTPDETFTAYPALVSDDPEVIGELDMLLFCTKGYDLKTAAEQYKACIKQGTIVLPLLNGVENTEILQELLPGAAVLKGCTYIVSKIESPGHIMERGSFNELFFGAAPLAEAQLDWFSTLLDTAGIKYTQSKEINLVIWRKFLFVCPIGTLTSYLDQPIGYILENSVHKDTLLALMKEIAALAEASGVGLGAHVLEETLEKMHKLPYETTSSLQADFKNGRRTELESLTGYVFKTSKKKGLEAPRSEEIYRELKLRLPVVE